LPSIIIPAGGLARLMVNLYEWLDLPKRYQIILIGAAAYTNSEMLAKYDARDP
jgi:TRAP-type mannitol/chloroaromatic compound transport system substrate-binding protein